MNSTMDPKKFKRDMGMLAFGNALHKAAVDYRDQLMEKQCQRTQEAEDVDLDELANDPDLEKLHRERIKKMKAEAEEAVKLSRKGHGEFRTITEKEFLPEILAKKNFQTKFVRVDAEGAPFFIQKLKVQVLPCVVMFKNGKAVDRIVGFEDLGGEDDFRTRRLENRFKAAGLLVTNNRRMGEDDDDYDDAGGQAGGHAESSDDDDD